jgi:hypothetical protein
MMGMPKADSRHTEDRGQRTEDRGQRTEDKGQRTDTYGNIGGRQQSHRIVSFHSVLLNREKVKKIIPKIQTKGIVT